MRAKYPRAACGWRVYGLGVMAMGAVNLVLGAFDPTQPVPEGLPFPMALADLAAAFLLIAGAAIQWPRMTARAGAALAAYFGLLVALFMNGRVVVANYAEYGAYFGAAEAVALATGGLVVFAANAGIDAARAARLTRLAGAAFGVCALFFGGAHFFYMTLTAPLVPLWLPPSQIFWGYATGICHIAGGLALLAGVQARLSAILLTIMYASFTPLVHVPRLFADAASAFNWTENALNLALIGTAWVVADSLAPRRRA